MVDTTLAVPSVASPSVQGNIDVAQVTNPTLAATVLRENIVVADPVNYTGQAMVTNARGLMVDNQLIDVMRDVLIELRVITQVLGSGLNVQDDPALLRADPTIGV